MQVEIDKPVVYADRAALDRRLLVDPGAPLAQPLEIAGHPLLTIFVSCPGTDCCLFAYLEDEAPDGRVRYVTEGMLRALHRRVAPAAPADPPLPLRSYKRADAWPLEPDHVAELAFDLLPIAYLFAAEHRVRLALAGADRDHFAPIPGAPPSFTVHRGATLPLRLRLPVVGPAST